MRSLCKLHFPYECYPSMGRVLVPVYGDNIFGLPPLLFMGIDTNMVSRLHMVMTYLDFVMT